MNLAVRFYSSVTPEELQFYPVVLPADWPIEVRELGESTELPGEGWALMTQAEYDAHRAAHMDEYLASFVEE